MICIEAIVVLLISCGFHWYKLWILLVNCVVKHLIVLFITIITLKAFRILSLFLYTTFFHWNSATKYYYAASSVSGQDKPNPALWLATRTGKKERYCTLACFVSAIKFRRCPSGCMKLPFRKIFSVSVKIISVIFLLGWNTVVDEFQEHILQQNRQTQKWKHEATWRRGMSNNRSFID